MPNLVGIGNSQVPTNAMLGGLAYQDPAHVVIKEADITNIAEIKAKKSGDASPQQTSAAGGRTVFVYDTRKDSDGGAWRYRCSNLSWYNEGPSSIRGDRKIFPCVAVIVSYGSYVDIYDADQPECPLWMRFPDDNSNRNVMYGTGNVRCVYALNGVMVFGSNATNFWPVLINFVTDEIIGVRTESAGHLEYGGGIADRGDNATNDGSLWWSGNGRDRSKWWFQNCAIYSNLVYDAVMYVPPDAPIWEPMGLPAPSIIWGTASGVTIWEGTPARSHNSSVMSGHKAPNLSKVNRLGQFCAVYNNANPTYVKFFPALYGQLDENHYNHYDASVALGMSIQWDPQGAKCLWLGKTTNGWYDLMIYNDSGYGFNIYYGGGRDGAQTNATRMMTQITSKYNTGIQPPNCQLCALATTTEDNYYAGSTVNHDTTVTITGAELLTNPMPTSNITGWTDNSGSGSSISYSSNGGGSIYLNGSSAYANATQAITTVVGQWYAFSVGAEAQTFSSQHNIYLLAGNSAPSGQTFNAHTSMICRPQDSGQSEEMPVVLQFQATATTTYVSVHSGWPVYVRDMRLRKCDPDRMFRMDQTQHSQRGRGLPIYGTLTLKPVAPGAELLSYSGFSGSNYLGGLYTPNLNFGSTQQYISVWIKSDLDSGLGYVFARGSSDGAESMRLGVRNDVIYFDYGDGSDYVQSNNGISAGRWNHLFCYVKAGQKGEIFVNGVQQPYSNQNAAPSSFLNATTYNTTIGQQYGSHAFPGEIALLRIGGLIPSNQAIQRIYEEEWKMFQPNAKCTMQGIESGVSDDYSHVRAAEYDEDTDILHVGNTKGRSDFRGLVRINSHTDAINASIAASGGVIVES